MVRHRHCIARALRACLAALLLGGALAGNAQVIRCTDPVTGSVTYTDADCAQGQSRREVAPKQTREDIERQYEQAREALRMQREQQQVQATQPPATPPSAAGRDTVEPSQSPQCLQARAALQGAMALDPTLYDTNTRIAVAQDNADLACLTPAQYARLQRRTNNRPPAYAGPGYVPPVIVVPPPRPPRPHRAERKPEMVNCNVFRCYDAQGRSYPR